jgi:hypothetical protein
MEWTDDEMFLYINSKYYSTLSFQNWPSIGPVTSQGFLHPVLYLWIYSLLALFSKNPIDMVRMVMVLNALAIVGLAMFFYLHNSFAKERVKYLWAVALTAVSPFAILFSRKIWSQDLLCFFSLLIMFFHTFRKNRFSSLLWGFFSGIIGQIHLSGLFFSASFFVSTLIFDRKNIKKTKWSFWLVGLCLSLVPMLKWFIYMLSSNRLYKLKLSNLIELSYLKYFILNSVGISRNYFNNEHLYEYLKLPYFLNIPTFIVGISHIFLFLIAIWAFLFQLKRIKNWRSIFYTQSLINFYFLVAIINGLLITFTAHEVFDHYLIVLFPIPCLWLANILKSNTYVLSAVVVAQLVVSSSYLYFNHHNCSNGRGYPDSLEYGTSYICNPHSEDYLKKNYLNIWMEDNTSIQKIPDQPNLMDLILNQARK